MTFTTVLCQCYVNRLKALFLPQLLQPVLFANFNGKKTVCMEGIINS